MWIDTHVHLLDSKKSRPNWAEIDCNRSMNTTFKVLSLSPMLCSRFSQEPAPP